MNANAATRQRRVPPKAAPRPAGVRVRRRWSSTRRSLYRAYKRGREKLVRGHRGVEKPPHWRRTPKKTIAKVVTCIGALSLVLLVLRALWVSVIVGDPDGFPFGFNPDEACRETGYSCGVTSGIAMTFLSLAFAGAVFFLYRLERLRRPFMKRARDEPAQLVETAGTIIGNVVGRNELCHVIMDDLKDRRERRPHIVIGGVGAGKTAVLVELTKRLAENGAVPVPLRLRDAQTELDFVELARKRFISLVGRTAHSDAEAERAWRELQKDDQVVVLADGLEEALSERRGEERTSEELLGESTERDNKIRAAIRRAQRDRLPLVVASRPHDALAGVEAAIVELEPLGEEYALEYIEEGASAYDEHRLDWVIETANVTEAPIYLQLAQELNAKGLLGYAKPDLEEEDDALDTRGDDRVALRVRLLETWTRALEYGYFHEELPMSRELRRATVKQLGVLACAGLKKDTLEVKFSDLFMREKPGGEYRQRAIVNALRDTLARSVVARLTSAEADDTVKALQEAVKRGLQSAEDEAARRPPGEDAYRRAVVGELRPLLEELEQAGKRRHDPAASDEAVDEELGGAVTRGLRAAERGDGGGSSQGEYVHHELTERLRKAVRELYATDEFKGRGGPSVSDDRLERELKLAVSRGVRLGLVEARGEGVRFPHSIMQAYLGSLAIDGIIKEENQGVGLKSALRLSGRELLAALVMHSRVPREDDVAAKATSRRGSAGPAHHYDDSDGVRDALICAARSGEHSDAKRIDLVVAALEIDVAVKAGDVMHDKGYATRLAKEWPEKNEDRTVEEAKLGAITRVGEVMRTIAERARDEHRDDLAPDYASLYKIGCKDVWYPARLAAAQQIGRGGDQAMSSLLNRFESRNERCPGLLRALGPFLPPKDTRDASRESSSERAGDDAHDRAGDGEPRKDPPAAEPGAEPREGGGPEDAPGAQEEPPRTDPPRPSSKGDPRATVASEELPRRYTERGWHDEVNHRELVLRAWLAPLLVSSSQEHAHKARDNLQNWLRYLFTGGGDHEDRLPISLEIALAQGFKHAANRRPGRSRVGARTRGYLAEQAAYMLEHAHFWFSRLTLVQALCLWALPDPEVAKEQQRPQPDLDRPRRRRVRQAPARGSDPSKLIDHWLSSSAGGHEEHPFVDEARKLAAVALEKNQPERYIWIDESGVVSKIGSRPPHAGARRKHNLWIPPSIGWVALDSRAQRLVADVLILLNLAERGADPPQERERRLRRAMRDDLPSCLTGERTYLQADSTVGMVDTPTPGASCKDDCAFDLCPYPAKGLSQTYRVELSEAFCRRQRVLIGRWWQPFPRRTARWQGALPRELAAFWRAMEARARL